MKKLSKILVVLSLVFVFCMPLVMSGCLFGGGAKIEIHTNFKNEYVVGENLDVSNGKLTYTNENGKKNTVVITQQMVSGFSSETVGNFEMVITYEGETLTYAYEVYQPVDLSVGDLFYCNPSPSAAVMGSPNPENYYDYVKVFADNKIYVTHALEVTPTQAPEFFADIDISYALQFTRSIENKKVKYTYSYVTDSSYMSYEIVVDNANQVTLSASANYFSEPLVSVCTKNVIA